MIQVSREEFNREFAALLASGRSVHLQLDALQAWMLFSTIQLALRHPENRGPTADQVRRIAEQIEPYLTEGYPTWTAVAAEGWRNPLEPIAGEVSALVCAKRIEALEAALRRIAALCEPAGCDFGDAGVLRICRDALGGVT